MDLFREVLWLLVPMRVREEGEGEDMKDLKFGRPFKREEIRQAIEGRLFFSMSEGGTNEAIRDILQELYSEPSKYEI